MYQNTRNVARRPRLVVAVMAVFLLTVLAGGCCTMTCCLSKKCRTANQCKEEYIRTITIIDDRIDGCPNTWAATTLMTKNDVLEVINCSSQDAKLVFSPGTFFNEGGTHQVPKGSSLRLTVSNAVSAGNLTSFVILGQGGCSHPGSDVIIQGGP